MSAIENELRENLARAAGGDAVYPKIGTMIPVEVALIVFAPILTKLKESEAEVDRLADRLTGAIQRNGELTKAWRNGANARNDVLEEVKRVIQALPVFDKKCCIMDATALMVLTKATIAIEDLKSPSSTNETGEK